MKIKDITNYLEQLAPLPFAEDFDNVGLLIGSPNTTVNGILVTLDTLEKTVDEAIQKGCNLILSFHPIIFSGLKKLNGNSYVEKVVLKAIKNDIAIYATHTALDNVNRGVSAKMCEILSLKNTKTLLPKKGMLKKLTTYVPSKEAGPLRKKLFEAGAGNIGNYDNCSFNTTGTGTFHANENANPVLGKRGELVHEEETCITVTFIAYLETAIIKCLLENHPYEEVAYEVITLDNSYQDIGMGMQGELEQEMDAKTFLKEVKTKFKTKCIRHSAIANTPIKKVAVLGGSGAFAIGQAKKQKADAYISADFKYHDFFKAENEILLVDVGHYESEQFTKNLLVDYLRKKFSTFAIILSEESTNPIYYI
ncbi:Nif3-like dinuclear metal center hexameric protein [Tenacibaculum sp. SG-28]|uniref:Nif3-like dinuclear metal center hexameric protein n=1 Tax=Tenacibaculum sp. SG-28 TaxID=754426 RepID=UPI000CF473EA|nr:Nif3-like dinuclear metal center hexameric protein [Tenacibaculum sp. SG-28]PQJ20649.1 Nif3-like dinuclear metal center hexameric protein [Tenacibaculum sp. SG-28]